MFEIEKRFSPARVLRPVVVVEWKTVKCVLLIAAAGKWCPSEAKLNDTKRTNLALSHFQSLSHFSFLFCSVYADKKEKKKWKMENERRIIVIHLKFNQSQHSALHSF